MNDTHPQTEIEQFNLALIADFFKRLPRQGPGSDAQTRRALALLPPTFRPERVADIGCGTGAQTAVLAENLQADITAVDVAPEMIEGLNRRLSDAIARGRVHPVCASMDNLPFAPESLDLIWCEGAAFIMGFEQALRYWHAFVRSGGYVALSECVWLTEDHPTDCAWTRDNVPEIATIAEKARLMEAAGFDVVGTFGLPTDCWTTAYYDQMPQAIAAFLADHRSDTARWFTDRLQEEMDFYRAHQDCFGYAFFVGRKV